MYVTFGKMTDMTMFC